MAQAELNHGRGVMNKSTYQTSPIRKKKTVLTRRPGMIKRMLHTTRCVAYVFLHDISACTELAAAGFLVLIHSLDRHLATLTRPTPQSWAARNSTSTGICRCGNQSCLGWTGRVCCNHTLLSEWQLSQPQAHPHAHACTHTTPTVTPCVLLLSSLTQHIALPWVVLHAHCTSHSSSTASHLQKTNRHP